jgi:hypothetical protein
MPWEFVGECGSGNLPDDADWIDFCHETVMRYVKLALGEPPEGCELGMMLNDHDLGAYPSIGVYWAFPAMEAPANYISRAEALVSKFNQAIWWGRLYPFPAFAEELEAPTCDGEEEVADDGPTENPSPGSFNFYTYQEEQFFCKRCGWRGLGAQLDFGEKFDEHAELNCPNCNIKVSLVMYPTLADAHANWDRLSDSQKDGINFLKGARALIVATRLEDPYQLQEITEPTFTLSWDFSREMTVLRLGDRVIFSEPAVFEGYWRFEEVALILKERYGSSLSDLIPTPASETYLYGDSLSASERVDKFRADTFAQRTTSPIGTMPRIGIPKAPMLSFDTVPSEWPTLPRYQFLRARPATAQDLDEHRAVFMIPGPESERASLGPDAISQGIPVNIPIPQYALWLPMGAANAALAVVIQAEVHPHDSLSQEFPSFGLRLANGHMEIGTDADTLLLGTDLAAIQEFSVKEMVQRFGQKLLSFRLDLAMFRQGFVADLHVVTSPRPRCLDLPALELRGRRYAAVGGRPYEWYSRILFEDGHRDFPGVPLEHRIIDLVAYPECPTREFHFTQFTLADALLERENLSVTETAVFDAWFAQRQVQSTIAGARLQLAEMDRQRALKPFRCNLYSRLQHFLTECRLERALADQWRRTLENACAKGLSKAEIAWSGLPEFLALRDGTIARKDMIDALDLGPLRLRVFEEVRCENCTERVDGTLNADAAVWDGRLQSLTFADDVRLWPRNSENKVGDDIYQEWRILAEDDVVDVTEPHFGGQRNAIAHLRTTVRNMPDGEQMLCIDEAQAGWAACFCREPERVIPDTPYRQKWIDVAARVVLLIAASKRINRVGWISGKIAQELHLEGAAPQLNVIYDQLLPRALRRALRGTTATFSTVSIPTWTRDWQVRYHGETAVFKMFAHGLPISETYPAREDACHALALRAQPTDETLCCVELDEALLNAVTIAGLPWLGAPDWTREDRESHGWRRDCEPELFALEGGDSPPARLPACGSRLRNLTIDVRLRWGNRLAYEVEWSLYVDGFEIRQTLDPVALLRSTVEAGDFCIFTCTCGDAGCAGIEDPVLVAHTARTVRWDFVAPALLDVEKGSWQTLLFAAQPYRKAITLALTRTRELLVSYPEAGTGISDDRWRDVQFASCFPPRVPSPNRVPADAKRIDIGWFWSKASEDDICLSDDFDCLLDGKRESIWHLLPIRSVQELLPTWIEAFWNDTFCREREEHDHSEHPLKRKGSFAQINKRGFTLAKIVSKAVPKTVAVWFHPVGAFPLRPERACRNLHALPARPLKRSSAVVN